MRALNIGNMSGAAFFYSCGFVIPTFAGTVIFNEELTLFRVIGAVILVISFCINCLKKDNEKSVGREWIIFALLAMISSGMIGLIQKIHQSSEAKDELGIFMILAFLICFILSLLLSVIGKSQSNPPILPAIICGICIGISNIINTQLSGMLPALILFPVLNGGVVIASAIAAKIFCKETLGKHRIVAIFLGVVSIILISI